MPNRNFNLTNSMGNLCTDIMGALKANQVSDEEKLHISDKQGYTICIGDDNIGYVLRL